jgi:hypothetical protein
MPIPAAASVADERVEWRIVSPVEARGVERSISGKAAQAVHAACQSQQADDRGLLPVWTLGFAGIDAYVSMLHHPVGEPL